MIESYTKLVSVKIRFNKVVLLLITREIKERTTVVNQKKDKIVFFERKIKK